MRQEAEDEVETEVVQVSRMTARRLRAHVVQAGHGRDGKASLSILAMEEETSTLVQRKTKTTTTTTKKTTARANSASRNLPELHNEGGSGARQPSRAQSAPLPISAATGGAQSMSTALERASRRQAARLTGKGLRRLEAAIARVQVVQGG